MTVDHCPAHLACRSGDQDEAPRPPPAPGSPSPSISGFGIADVFYDGTEYKLPQLRQYGEELSLPEVRVWLLVPRIMPQIDDWRPLSRPSCIQER
ncbi:hypothetical protein AVEN_141132-1 [Araneus ventricosus]|uniref:Uncharacterized protein n=1 Tax=Araneus ventricosus TaxID=182803 RepID=A0A4Y2J283_ARAVE|nr:hypothetical protein AVEN_141132-1 [Araneus ventricosus]